MQHKDKLPEDERKARRLESARKYREANKEKCVAASVASRSKNPEHYKAKDAEYKMNPAYLERQRVYRQQNKDALNSATMAWRAANLDKYQVYQRTYLQENQESTNARARLWRKCNSARAAEVSRNWRIDNPGEHARHEQNRRARIRNAGGNLSKGIYQKLMRLQHGKCPVCGTKLDKSQTHIDHVMPIVKGGTNTDDNVQLLCQTCNNSKHAKHPIKFMQERGFLL